MDCTKIFKPFSVDLGQCCSFNLLPAVLNWEIYEHDEKGFGSEFCSCMKIGTKAFSRMTVRRMAIRKMAQCRMALSKKALSLDAQQKDTKHNDT
jgi:hypothetical protein